MNTKSTELLALYLPKPLNYKKLQLALGAEMQKRLEGTYYLRKDDFIVVFTQFNVLAMVNMPPPERIALLQALGIDAAEHDMKQMVYQDYNICFDPALTSPFTVSNEAITLQSASDLNMVIIAYVIAQSVALDVYEQKLADYSERSRTLIEDSDSYSLFKRTRLARFAKQLVLIRHDLLIDLYLLDKPNILWDNADAEALYNSLATALELSDRFEVVSYKLGSIKDDIIMVMDITNHKHSSFLEWIIIVLIAVEIGMGLIEWFKPAFLH
ncbi:RMD1 family protein [Sulfurimonas sp. HSL-1656]|uniref:RMD1 family protein n=1 Tax=Thiomicrolovo subterrani TaxID=3131934 RepID=UPI0031F9C395